MQRLAKALAAVSCAILIGALLPVGHAMLAVAADSPPGLPPRYRGPAALFDPADPFQGLRWTLGMTLPPRNRVGQARQDLVPRIDYDHDRGLVLLSYRIGNLEILPPRSMTREEYAGFAMGQELRKAWIDGHRRVLTEIRTGQTRGLVNLSLPFQLPFTEKIFGQGAPNLRVTGNEQITFSGWIMSIRIGSAPEWSISTWLTMM